MNPKNIIPVIHRHRENLARKCGCDVKKLMDHFCHCEAGRDWGGGCGRSSCAGSSARSLVTMLALQQRKRAVIKATLGGEESLVENLTWEEIQGLFD